MQCTICNKAFIQEHFNQKLCSDDCKRKAKRSAKKKYKQTEKGRVSNQRWVKSERRIENEKRYKRKPEARRKAVIRTTRHLQNCEACREKKKARDRAYAKTEKGRIFNRKAVRKYGKTDAGRISAKTYKYRLRHNESGPIIKEQWEEKLKTLGGRCQHCGTTEDITIDHINPLSKGGINKIENLQPLCRSCNCSKGSGENGLHKPIIAV